MTTSSEAERLLLEEGVDSYVPAVSAILAFRELVQSRCRRVVEKRLEERVDRMHASHPQKCDMAWNGKRLAMKRKSFLVPSY